MRASGVASRRILVNAAASLASLSLARPDGRAAGLIVGLPSILPKPASKGRELSEEDGANGGRRFSVTIDNILTRHLGFDLDGNGAISVDDLYRGLKAQVVRDSEGRQTPRLLRNLMVGDFEIF